MKTLIIVTHRRLDQERSGSKTYLRRMMALAEEAGYSLKILFLPRTSFCNRPWTEVSPEFENSAMIIWPGSVKLGNRRLSFSASVWARFGWRLIQEILRILNAGPASWRKPHSNLATVPSSRELRAVANEIRRLSPNAVMVEYSSLGPLLDLLPETIGKSILVHDSFAARSEQFRLQNEPSDYSNPPNFQKEALRMRSAHQIYHASVKELQRFDRLMDDGATHLWFRPSAPVYRDKVVTRDSAELVYIGANQRGSRDAIAHFLGEIWPLVLRDMPEAKLNIVGPVGPTIPGNLLTSGTRICGRVEHLYEFAGPDMIGILPTRLMSGISIKVGEYLGMGLPIVAYPVGIDGYGDALKGVVQTGDTPDAFASLVVNLLRNREHRNNVSRKSIDAAETVLRNDDIVEGLKKLSHGVSENLGQ